MKLFAHALVLVLALVLSACGESAKPQAVAAAPEDVRAHLSGAPEAADAMVALYQQAIAADEDGPTVYIASVPEELKPLTDAFDAAFPGLHADYQRYIGDRLAARLDGEYASGNHQGDIVLASTVELRHLKSVQRLAPFMPANIEVLEPQYRDPDGAYFSFYKKPFAVAYNVNLVPADQVPQTLADVLDPKWRGRFTFPASSGAASSIGNAALVLLAEQGRASDRQIGEFFRYGAGGPPSSELIPSVAQGRYAFAVLINTAATQAQIARGAPLAIAFPRDLSVQINVAGGVLSEAPDPISSQLYLTWLLSPQAQKILADLNFYGAATGAPIPQNYPPLSAFINGGVPEDDAWQARLDAFQQHRQSLAQ
jgi:iron(III) transport system substrate-binding protein